MVTVEICTIGDELNRGEIVDTNSAWLAERLTSIGAYVRWRTSVTDDAGDMDAVLRTAAGRADLVVCSGGLGPTEDDRTVDVASALVGKSPVVDSEHEARMQRRFAERGFRLTPNNVRQVRVPDGAIVLPNAKGLAPGFGVAFGRAQLFFMPGVPREMKPMFDAHLAPRVQSLVGDARLVKRTWRAAGIGESHVDHALKGILDGVPDATLHFRIAYPENFVTVVVKRDDPAEAERVLEALDGEVRARLGDHVYATGDTTLAEAVGQLLVAKKATLAVAESCTGGLVGQLVTSVPGSSRWFVGGVISYANELKEKLLGVAHETLMMHGAVSEPCVIEMADGARKATGADYAIAVSGIAGPDGGTAEKPVGTVFIAITAGGGDGVRETRKMFWPAERDQVRMLAAFSSLHLLFKILRANS
jgi:nicotinamide-nucleotide amidase